MKSRYSFKEVLENAERIRWRVEDIIGGNKRLDFDRPFLPESLARVGAMDFLSDRDKLLPADIEKGLGDYAALGGTLNVAFREQVEFDMRSFESAAGRLLGREEQDRFR
jgi:hypothetical protein